MFLYALVAVVVVTALICKFHPLQHNNIPAVGHSGLFTSYLTVIDFYRDGLKVLMEGARRYKLYKMPMFDKWIVLVNDPEMINEMRSAKDSDINFQSAAVRILQVDYTLGPYVAINPFHVAVIRGPLTRNIGLKFPEVFEEIQYGFNKYIPVPDNGDWVAIPMLETMRKIIVGAANRFYVGLPLCRDPDWVDQNITFTLDIAISAFKMNLFPDAVKPIVGRILSPYSRQMKRARRTLGKIVEERLEMDPSDPDYPNDLISWILSQAEGDLRTVDDVIMRILLVNFASIHTSSNSLTQALFHLAATHKQYADPMREEVKRIIDEEGWSKASIGKMRKVDSFMRESQRMGGIGSLLMQRGVTNPNGYTFANGKHFPFGTFLAVPTYSIHHDEKIYPNPYEFDGFRYANLRSGSSDESAKHQYVNTSLEYMGFGHGRHACPGRFFASNTLKAMLAYTLLNYDIKLSDDSSRRPPDNWIGSDVMPSSADIIFRKRKQD